MATFTQDPTNSGLVISSDGRILPKDMLSPTDTVISGTAPTQPATPAATTSVVPPVGPGVDAPLTAAAVLAKRDKVLSGLDAARPAGAGGMVTVGSTTTTSTQNAVPESVLAPVLDRNTQRGEQQAGAVERAGEERAQRQEQQAMATTTDAFGRQQMAEQDRAEAEQRAAIARQNELALSLQKDPSIDADRFVRNMSTGNQILTTVLAAINGAFKGMVGQQGNDVLDILQRRISQDIESQKEQIQSGRIRRGNLIAYFQNQGLREEAAERAAEATSWAMLDRMAQAEQQRIGAGEHRTEAAVLAESIRAQTESKNDELRLSLGTPRSTTSTTTQRANPAAMPGATPVTQLANAKAARDLEQLQKSGLTQEEFNKQSTEYSEKAAKNDDLVQRATAVVEALGGRVEPVRDEKGKITGYRVTGELDTPHFGDEATRYESAVSTLQRADVMGMAREPSAKLQDQFAQAAEMPFRDAQKAVRLQQILNMAVRERTNLQSGYNEHVTMAVDSTKSPVGIPYPEAP
jgi:hypothetical protein